MSDERLNNALATLVERLTDSLTAAGNAVSEHAPELIHQLLLWATLRYSVLAFVGLSLISGAVVLGRQARIEYTRGRNPECVGFSVPCVICAVVGLVVTCAAGTYLLKVTITPDVWLLDYAHGLLRSGS